MNAVYELIKHRRYSKNKKITMIQYSNNNIPTENKK